MRRYHYGGLLISTSCSSLTLIAKDHFPPIKKAKHTQAVIPAVQTITVKKSSLLLRYLKKCKRNIAALLGLLWLWLLTRFYTTKKNCQIPGWQLGDLALLKIIKDNAIRLWNNHHPDRKIIR